MRDPGGRYEVRAAKDPDDIAACLAVRHEVFVGEQNVPAELENDEHDPMAVHVLAVALPDRRPLGAGRLRVREGGEGLLGRLAVTRAARGLGIGAALVRAIEAEASRLGLAAVELHAQTQALGFYERLGYGAYGAEFREAGIVHRSMRKPLR